MPTGMKSLFKRITGDQSPAEGEATGFPHAVAHSVHSLIQRFTGPAMPHRDETVDNILRQPSGASPEDTVTTASQVPPEFPSPREPRRRSNQVNHEPSSTGAHLPHSPRNSVTSPATSTVGRKGQDARRNNSAPLRRYFSPSCHSFPDYGQIKPEGKMGRGNYVKRVNASFSGGPVNTMSSSKTQTVSRPPVPASKRQRTDQSGNYTAAAFAPMVDHDDVAEQRKLKKERRGSGTITSADEKTYGSMVKEFRAVEGRHDPTKQSRGHRSRPHRPRLVQNDYSRTPVDPTQDDSDDPVTEFAPPRRPVLPGAEAHGTGRVGHRSGTDSADLAILGAGSSNKARPSADQQFAHTQNRGKKRYQQGNMTHEMDELAGDDDYQPRKKVSMGQKRQEPGQSSSISVRGDMKPSLDAGHKPGPLEEEPLPLKALVWAPGRIYEAPESSADGQTSESLVLRSQPAFLDNAELSLHRATSASEAAPEFKWFKIPSQKITLTKINYEKSLVRLAFPSNPYFKLGATLYLRLYCEDDTRKFSAWIHRYSKVSPTMDPDDKLEKEFMRQYGEVAKRPMPTRPTQSSPALRPAAEAAFQRWPRGRGVTATTALPGRRLIDGLASSSAQGSGLFGYPVGEDEVSEETAPRRSGRARRDVASPVRVPLLDRWTEVHPDWDKNWRLPLSFHRTAVEKDDIARLDEGECLNDNIIGFYLKYLQIQAEKERPETSKKVYFHNSFFYSKLKPTSGRHINYDGVKNWTAKVDLFSYDYIVVPVNEHFHWWVAIICNPARLDSTVAAEKASGSPESGDDVEEVLAVSSSATAAACSPPPIESDVVMQDRHDPDPLGIPDGTDFEKDQDAVVTVDDGVTAASAKSAPQKGRKRNRKSLGAAQRKYNPADPRIITLDSLGASHSPVCTHLKQYLVAEFKDKKGKDIEYNQPIGMRATNIPEQDNFCDCGLYLLKYVAEFLGDPDKFIQSMLQREGREWNFDASKLRNDIRQLIFDLQEPYQKEQEEAKRRKALAKQKREHSKSEGPTDGSVSSAPKSPAERALSPQKAADATPAVSARTSPAVERPVSPQQPAVVEVEPPKTAQTKTPSKAQQNGPSETTPKSISRSFVVVDIPGKPQSAEASRPKPPQSPVRAPQPLPSIEIPDDDEPPATPAQQPPPSPRQTSGNARADVVVEEATHKDAGIHGSGGVPIPVKTYQQHKRNRSRSQTVVEVASPSLADDEKATKPAEPASSPAKKALAPVFEAGSAQKRPEKSPYFARRVWRGDEQAKINKTNKGATGSRKISSGGTIDLTDE